MEKIEKYEKGKYLQIAKLSKPGSPIQIRICTADPEYWFYDLLRYKGKTGEITQDSFITANQLAERLSSLKADGYAGPVRKKYGEINFPTQIQPNHSQRKK